MAEFDDNLNKILGDPNAMSQIMQLAQSLGGGGEQQQSQPQNSPPPPSAPSGGGGGGMDTQMISRFLPLLQEFGGQQDSNAKALLYALRPYLKPERQNKVERALQLARLFHMGKAFLAGWGKDHV